MSTAMLARRARYTTFNGQTPLAIVPRICICIVTPLQRGPFGRLLGLAPLPAERADFTDGRDHLTHVPGPAPRGLLRRRKPCRRLGALREMIVIMRSASSLEEQ